MVNRLIEKIAKSASKMLVCAKELVYNLVMWRKQFVRFFVAKNENNRLALFFILFLTLLLTALMVIQIPIVWALSISPTIIELPTLMPGDSIVVPIISSADLILVKNTCQSAQITLESKESTLLHFDISGKAVSSKENCTLSLAAAQKQSVIYTLPVTIKINSTLNANVTISYTETELVLRNEGNGTGQITICDANSNETLNIVPYNETIITPSGATSVGVNQTCANASFVHQFPILRVVKNAKTNLDDANISRDKNVLIIILAVVGIVIVLGLVLYFAIRKRAFLKDTRGLG